MDGEGQEVPRILVTYNEGVSLLPKKSLPFLEEPSSQKADERRILTNDHVHADCRSPQRKWLERRRDEAATMRAHTYCVTCGKVKNLDGPRAKKLGYYLSGLSALKEYLERSGKHGKITQSQSRLITKALEGCEDFEDRYSLSLDIQLRLYLKAVRTVRPDLDEEVVLRLLPSVRRYQKQTSTQWPRRRPVELQSWY